MWIQVGAEDQKRGRRTTAGGEISLGVGGQEWSGTGSVPDKGEGLAEGGDGAPGRVELRLHARGRLALIREFLAQPPRLLVKLPAPILPRRLRLPQRGREQACEHRVLVLLAPLLCAEEGCEHSLRVYAPTPGCLAHLPELARLLAPCLLLVVKQSLGRVRVLSAPRALRVQRVQDGAHKRRHLPIELLLRLVVLCVHFPLAGENRLDLLPDLVPRAKLAIQLGDGVARRLDAILIPTACRPLRRDEVEGSVA